MATRCFVAGKFPILLLFEANLINNSSANFLPALSMARILIAQGYVLKDGLWGNRLKC
jgi:hypothetical protein